MRKREIGDRIAVPFRPLSRRNVGFWRSHCTGPQARQPGQTRRDMKRKNSTTIPSTIKPAIFLNTFLAIIILGSFSPLVQFIQEIPSNSPPKTVSSVDLKASVPVHLSPPRGLHPTTKKKIPANRNTQPARLVTPLQVMTGSGSIAAVASKFCRGTKCPICSRLQKSRLGRKPLKIIL